MLSQTTSSSKGEQDHLGIVVVRQNDALLAGFGQRKFACKLADFVIAGGHVASILNAAEL